MGSVRQTLQPKTVLVLLLDQACCLSWEFHSWFRHSIQGFPMRPSTTTVTMLQPVDVESLGKALDINLLTPLTSETSTRLKAVKGLFGWLVPSTTRLYRGRVPRLTSDNFTCCHTRDRADTMTYVSAVHIKDNYTDTYPTSRERSATAGIEPRTSSTGVARSTD